jgi:hypothetical protein
MTADEEPCAGATLHVAVSPGGAICGVTKDGERGIAPAMLQVGCLLLLLLLLLFCCARVCVWLGHTGGRRALCRRTHDRSLLARARAQHSKAHSQKNHTIRALTHARRSPLAAARR